MSDRRGGGGRAAAIAGPSHIRDAAKVPFIIVFLLPAFFFLAVFLAFSKRRSEGVTLGDGAGEHRAILRDYSPHLLDESHDGPVVLQMGEETEYVDTGDPLPDWANAVVPVELVELVGSRGGES